MVQGAIDGRRKVLAGGGPRLWSLMLLCLEDLLPVWPQRSFKKEAK